METNTIKKTFLYAGFLLIACIATSVSTAGQSPSPSPTSSGSSSVTNIGGFDITSSVEIGLRGLDVNGDHEKYRSDLNYGPGVRVFDSSFLMENTLGSRRPFDSLLVQSSGWGGDPTGSFRLNVDRTGLYKFDSNIRKVRYYNNLKTHVINFGQPISTGSEHRANTLHHFGDFDLTIFPERDLRFRFGYSFNDTEGPATSTIRFSSDEYMVPATIKSRSDDIRLGVEGKLLGFNWGLNYGRRNFRDKSQFFNDGLNLGNNTAATTSQLNFLNRQFDTKGTTDFIHGYIQRTFARRLDFTSRFIYSDSRSDNHENDFIQGRASSTGNVIFSDVIDVLPADGRRPQARGDLGVTYRVTDRFRVSNTFTFDQFSGSGSHLFYELLQQRTAAGGPLNPTLTRSSAWRAQSYQRISNLLEGDYQVSRRLSFNLGWRWTTREVGVGKFDVNLVTGAVARSEEEDLENTTNSFIAGMRVKPTSNWTIYADLEKGEADNVFTRLANNDYFNFRVRSVANVKNVTFNLSFITRDNEDNGMATTTVTPPVTETVADTSIRIFSGNVDWAPRNDLSFAAGYTYNWQTSRADIIVPVGTPIFTSTRFLLGLSEYYVRSNYFFFDVTVRPHKRLSVYAHYSIDDDGGQGSRLEARPQDIISSYPMTYQMPEIKLAIKLTRNIDWNVGYQYYSYDEVPPVFPFATPQVRVPAQNYSAHMPYTSVRFYFGRGVDDR